MQRKKNSRKDAQPSKAAKTAKTADALPPVKPPVKTTKPVSVPEPVLKPRRTTAHKKPVPQSVPESISRSISRPVPEIVPEPVPEEEIPDEPVDESIPLRRQPRPKQPQTKATAASAVKRQAEALLFSSGKAMEEEQLCTLIGCDLRSLRAALRTLREEYDGRETALKVFNEGTQWKLLVRDEHIPLVRRIVADTEMTRATMETLAVIAYRQPEALQSEVVDVRGGNAYEQIAELEELGFIVKKKKGRSFALRLTEKFYDYFDVEGADSIRRVFQDVKAPEPKEQQQRLGELRVVDEPAEAVKAAAASTGPVGGLEVIDEPERPEKDDGDATGGKDDEDHALNGFDLPETAKLEDDSADRNEFLSKIESQIADLSRRNDEHAKDETFKRRVPEGETQPTDGTPTVPAQDDDADDDGEDHPDTDEPDHDE